MKHKKSFYACKTKRRLCLSVRGRRRGSCSFTTCTFTDGFPAAAGNASSAEDRAQWVAFWLTSRFLPVKPRFTEVRSQRCFSLGHKNSTNISQIWLDTVLKLYRFLTQHKLLKMFSCPGGFTSAAAKFSHRLQFWIVCATSPYVHVSSDAFRCSSACSGGGTAFAGVITDRKRPALTRRTTPAVRGERGSSTWMKKKMFFVADSRFRQ